MFKLCSSVRIASAKKKPFVNISGHCLNQRLRNAIGCRCRITGCNTLPASLHKTLSLSDSLQKPVIDRPSGHTDRTVYNDYIILLGIYIGLFVADIRITFICGDKTCCHLYTAGSHFQIMKHILSFIYARCPPAIGPSTTTRSGVFP